MRERRLRGACLAVHMDGMLSGQISHLADGMPDALLGIMSNTNSTYSIPGTLTIGRIPTTMTRRGIDGASYLVVVALVNGVLKLTGAVTGEDITHLLTAANREMDLVAPQAWTPEHEALVAALEARCTLTAASLEGRIPKAKTYKLNHGDREVEVIGKPRRITGGYVVTVCWAADDETQRLRDGTIHPCHRKGFAWEAPIVNIIGYHPFCVASGEKS